MKAGLREQVLRLRTEGRLSYGEIKKRIVVSKSTLSRWLKAFPLSDSEIAELRRSNWERGETSRERYRETMRLKREAKRVAVYEEQMSYFARIKKRERFIAGLMLYLGEGSKTSPYSVIMTNTDIAILRFFMAWAEEFFAVPKGDFRFQLHLYENMSIEKERRYWMRGLDVRRSQFYKDQVRGVKNNTYSYGEGFRHGTCQVSFCDGKKKVLIMESIRAFMNHCYERV